MSIEWYDQDRFAHEWSADQDVLARLREQGDRQWIKRPVDLSFRGEHGALCRAEARASAADFALIGYTETDGEWRLDLSRTQTTEPEAIRQLTILALQIEAACNVVYDGWGCVTQNDRS